MSNGLERSGIGWRLLSSIPLVAALAVPAHADEIRLADLRLLSTTEVGIEFSQARTNRLTGERTMLAQVTNLTPDAIVTPIYLVIARIDPVSVVMKGMDGTTLEGPPYFRLDGPFGPSQVLSRDVVFAPTGSTRLPRFNVYPEVYRDNIAPEARAGPDQQVRVDLAATLDGTDSFDPDGDLITFNWTILQTPPGSSAVLDDATAPNPHFTPDLTGDYQFELTVSDGVRVSPPEHTTLHATQTVAALNAHAGDDQYALVGTLVTLDGQGSRGSNGLPLDYLWRFLEKPADSRLTDADILLADTPAARFVPDLTGTFILDLQVDDGLSTDGDQMIVLASESNVPPNADAGPPQAVRVGEEAVLDGRASIDPDGGPAPLRFVWGLVSRPAASLQTTADFQDAMTVVARFTPDTEGTYVARLRVDDTAFADADNTAVIADATPPVVEIEAPAEGAILDERRPIIRVSFSDVGSGIDPDRLRLLINGADVTAAARITEGEASYTPATDLPGGENQVTVRVADRAGNRTEVTHQFTIRVFRAIADCGPILGVAPHTVTYRTRGQFTGGSLVSYRWDRDGDGTFDTSTPVPQDYTWTFDNPGTYHAILEVQNNFGELATDTCSIIVQRQGPTVTAEASPSNGPAPLAVTLTCQGQSQNGTITRWEWDFDGDGLYDQSSTTTGATVHVYDTVGDYAARCRVTDSAGLIGVSATIDTTVRARPEGSPTVNLTANRTSGNAWISVSFSSTVSAGGPIALYEWDFDGDGTIDRQSKTTPTASYTYQAAGFFAPTLRVTNTAGQTSADSIGIELGITRSLSVLNGTFAPDTGGVATVRTTLSGTVPMRLFVQDRAGRVVRTLIDQTRVRGTYDDAWNGRDEAGVLLPDGVYYAVLEYAIGNRIERLDLTDSTGGTRYHPARNKLPSTFSPYANDPLAIEFTVPSTRSPSEILAFIGLFNTDTRLVTLVDRQTFGAGTHTLYWDGLLPSGARAVAPPGDKFLFGIWGYPLPKNAMYLASAPRISNPSVQPTLYSPTREGGRPLLIRFDLDKRAALDLTVTNLASGGVVFNGRFPGYPAGTSQILSWNGLNSDDLLPDRGEYRLALTAIGDTGGTSLTRYLLIRVFY